MPAITRDGATVHYEVSGDGPPILLGHSLLCGARMWAEVVPRLAERHRVVNAVFRGHAPSTAPGPFTLEDLAGDWRAILDAEGIDRALCCGLSMGGMVAMRLALAAPERVAGLALLDTAADADGWARRLQYRLLGAIYRRTGFTPFLLRRVAPLMFGDETLIGRPDLLAALADQVRSHRPAELYEAVRAVVGRGGVTGLERIRCPALVLVGGGRPGDAPRAGARHRRGHPRRRAAGAAGGGPPDGDGAAEGGGGGDPRPRGPRPRWRVTGSSP